MNGVRAVIISSCMFLVAAAAASAQQPHLPSTISQSQAMDAIPVTMGDAVQRQQAIAANQQRQVEIKRDMEKMAELTLELKEYLARSGEGVMSIDAIKKAEQIEKLAHSVKSKMKQVF
jgi:hypothetical protein